MLIIHNVSPRTINMLEKFTNLNSDSSQKYKIALMSPIPRALQAPPKYEPDIKVQEILKEKLAAGHIKKCKCSLHYIASSEKMCPDCREEDNAKKRVYVKK